MRILDGQNGLRTLALVLFRWIPRFAIRRPAVILVLAFVFSLACIPGLFRLKLRTDAHALVSQNAPEVLYDKALRDQFGIEDQLVLLIQAQHSDGIFNKETLESIRQITTACQNLPGINSNNVMSLATEPSFRMRPSSLIHETMLEPPLISPPEINQLREDLDKIRLYNGTFVSSDRKSTCILVGVPQGADRAHVYQQVLQLIAKDHRDKITVTGAPVAESLLGIHILEDLGVPKALLPAHTQARAGEKGWKLPGTFYELRLLIARKVGLVPVAAFVMILIFLMAFRNLLAALVPLPGVAGTMLFVFGMMGWFDVPIYLTMAVMPVLLIAIGVMNDVYLFNRYFSLLREKPNAGHIALLEETFDRLASPVAITSLTAAIGFGSFAFSPLQPVRVFGIFTALGVFFGLVYSLTVVPAMLALINPERLIPGRFRGPAETQGTLLAQTFEWLSITVVRYRVIVVCLLLLSLAVLPLGLRRLVVQDSWIDGFDPDSEFRQATRLINDQFFGMHLLFVSVELPETLEVELPRSALTQEGIVLPRKLIEHPALIAGAPTKIWAASGKAISNTNQLPAWQSHIEMTFEVGTNIVARVPRKDFSQVLWKEFLNSSKVHLQIAKRSHFRPELIRMLSELAAFIRERRVYAVGGVLDPSEYLSTTRFMARPTDPNARILPNDPGEIKLMWDFYGIARGKTKLHQIVDTNYWRSLTTVFLKDANFMDTARLMTDLREYERKNLTPKGIKLGFGGDVAVSQSLIQGIVSTQLQSLCWSLLGIYLVTAVLGGSWRWGVYCLLPSFLAILFKFAVMGWLNVPLGVATSMFAAMTLGIGVNCAIHLLEAYSIARSGGTHVGDALRHAIKLTGPPALLNTVSVSIGFGVLILSQVPANARLGLLLVVGLVNCFVVSLLLLPVLLHWWPIVGSRSVAGKGVTIPEKAMN